MFSLEDFIKISAEYHRMDDYLDEIGRLIAKNWKDKWRASYGHYICSNNGITFKIYSYLGDGDYDEEESIFIEQGLLNDKEAIVEYVKKFSLRRSKARDRLERLQKLQIQREEEELERQQFLKLKEKFGGE